MTFLYRNTCDAWNKLHQMTGEGTHHVTDGVGWLYEEKVFLSPSPGIQLRLLPFLMGTSHVSITHTLSFDTLLTFSSSPFHVMKILSLMKFFALEDFFTSQGITVFKSLLQMIDSVVFHAKGGIRRQNSINEKSRFHPKKHLRLTFSLKRMSLETLFWRRRDNFFLFIY